MGKSPEHHVGHFVQLLFYRFIEHGMVVSMYGAPPGSHAIDQFAAVAEFKINTFGGGNMIHGRRAIHRTVWVPDMFLVYFQLLFDA